MADCGCTDPGCGPLTEAGPRGPQGVPGPAPTFVVGDVTSVTSGNPPDVTLTEGPTGTWTIDFVLVAGPTGPTGATGPAGPAGTGIELLTTKGDLLSFSTVAAVLGVGADGTLVRANSLATFGIEWDDVSNLGVDAADVSFTPSVTIVATNVQDAIDEFNVLTTKGDLLGFSTVKARFPVGTDGQIVVADSTQALGVKYSNVPREILTITAVNFAASPYLLLDADEVLQVDVTGGAVTINIGLAATYTANRLFTVKDIANLAGTNNITINTSGGQTIDGATSYVMNVNSASVSFYRNGTSFYTV